ncbi:MAG: LacI family DNA-binding transcriptional regulator [Chlamydiota bacterium]
MTDSKKNTISLRDIAKVAKCSHTAVSLALRGDSSIPVETQHRIQKLARDMGYKKDPYATALMSMVRAKRPTGISAEIGWIHAIPRELGVDLPSSVEMRRGARERAQELGYRLCELTPLGVEKMSIRRVLQILRARRIQGVVLAHAHKIDTIPYFNSFPWSDFSVATIGDIHPTIPISGVVTDYVTIGLLLYKECVKRGYTRIGCSIPRIIDNYSGGRWNMLLDHMKMNSQRSTWIKPYQEVDHWDEQAFMKWIETTKPEVLLSNDPHLYTILEENGYKIPDDLSFICSNLWDPNSHITGTLIFPNKQGAAAIDIVDAQIRRGEKGNVSNPKTLSISPGWNEGSTLPYKDIK